MKKSVIRSICALLTGIICICTVSPISSSAEWEDYYVGSMEDVITKNFSDCLSDNVDNPYSSYCLVFKKNNKPMLLEEYKRSEDDCLVTKLHSDEWDIKYIAFKNTDNTLTEDKLISMFPELKLISPEKNTYYYLTAEGNVVLEFSVPLPAQTADENFYEGLEKLKESQLEYSFAGDIKNSNRFMIIKGDINRNHRPDIYDVITAAKYIMGKTSLSEFEIYLADYDGNKEVNMQDIIKTAKSMIPVKPVSTPALTYENCATVLMEDVINVFYNDNCFIYPTQLAPDKTSYIIIPQDNPAVFLTEYLNYVVERPIWGINYISFENTDGSLTEESLISMFPELKLRPVEEKKDDFIRLELSAGIYRGSIIDKDIYEGLQRLKESNLKYWLGFYDVEIASLAPFILKGDINRNNKLDIYDVITAAKYIMGKANLNEIEFYLADYDGNKEVNMQDVIKIAKAMIKK